MAVASYNSTFYVGSLPSVAFTDEATTTSDLTTFSISNAAKRYLDKSVATVVQAQYDETQLLTVTGGPTGGTVVLRFGGQNTSTIAYNASAATVQTALQALSSIGAGNALVTGSAGGPWTVEFAGAMAKTSEALITLQTNSLTGGASPSVAITEVQAGGTWATITTGFTLYRCNARVVFAVTQTTGTQVRLHSGNYIPYATLAQVHAADFSAKMDMLESTVFNTTGDKTYVPGLLSGTVKCQTWWVSTARMTSLLARDLIIVSIQTVTGNHYDGFCYAADLDIKADPKSLMVEDITLQLTDELFAA